MSPFDKNLPVHLVINPKSGYGGSRLMIADLRSEVFRAGMDLVEYTTRGPEDATRYVRGLEGKASAVLVWGGDGTVNEVANGLIGTDVPILPCRAGTENLLAKQLKIPRDPRKIIDILLEGQIVDCDVGLVNGRNFMMIIGIGFDGEVVRRLTAVRSGHISHLTYPATASGGHQTLTPLQGQKYHGLRCGGMMSLILPGAREISSGVSGPRSPSIWEGAVLSVSIRTVLTRR